MTGNKPLRWVWGWGKLPRGGCGSELGSGKGVNVEDAQKVVPNPPLPSASLQALRTVIEEFARREPRGEETRRLWRRGVVPALAPVCGSPAVTL